MKKIVLGSLVVFLLIICAGCQRNEVKTDNSASIDPSNIKNVVIILIDTLRADHLPFYGYKDTAPFLNSLAEKSVVFEKNFSASSTTAPSTASIFTGLYPSQHGVITGYITSKRLIKKGFGITLNKIPADILTLGELFKNAGYKTYSVADNLNISRVMGYDKGFDKFETLPFEGAEKINNKLFEWKKEIKESDKNFIYLHYIDPHLPYHCRKPWCEKRGRKLEHRINAYDSEISYLDSQIQNVFDEFGWLENSLIVLVSDHGEEFLDHGSTTHGKNLYREVIHVPFMVYYPNIKPARVADFTYSLDILPTLAEMLNLEKNSNWRGVSLVSAINGQSLPKRNIYSELLRRPEMVETHAAFRSVIYDGFHFIEKNENGKISYELYDLKKDFSEKNNIINDNKELAEKLKSSLAQLEDVKIDNSSKEINIKLDDNTVNQLKTLGYIN